LLSTWLIVGNLSAVNSQWTRLTARVQRVIVIMTVLLQQLQHSNRLGPEALANSGVTGGGGGGEPPRVKPSRGDIRRKQIFCGHIYKE